MDRIISRLYYVLVVLLSVCASFARLFQLIKYTDSQTGLVTSNYGLSYFIYALFGAALGVSVLYAQSRKKAPALTAVSGRKSVRVITVLLIFACFYDFIHQCYNLYTYVSEGEYIDYTRAAVLGALAVASLLCSAYACVASMFVGGRSYNFGRLGFLNFSVIIWAFLRLIMIMMEIVSFEEGTESFCEFLFLTALIGFFFSLISLMDNPRKKASPAYYVFALMSVFGSFVVSLPKLISILTLNHTFVHLADYSAGVYLLFGILSASLLLSSDEDNSGENPNI